MFTVNVQVKQVGPDQADGSKGHYQLLNESLYEAKSVIFNNEGDDRWVALNIMPDDPSAGGHTNLIFHTLSDKGSWYDIFVMNEQGQTVARYNP